MFLYVEQNVKSGSQEGMGYVNKSWLRLIGGFNFWSIRRLYSGRQRSPELGT